MPSNALVICSTSIWSIYVSRASEIKLPVLSSNVIPPPWSVKVLFNCINFPVALGDSNSNPCVTFAPVVSNSILSLFSIDAVNNLVSSS